LHLDEVHNNTAFLNVGYLKSIKEAMAENAGRKLAIMTTIYYGWEADLADHIREGSVDCIEFCYWYPHQNLSYDTLDSHCRDVMNFIVSNDTGKGIYGFCKMSVLIPASGLGSDNPNPYDYVYNCGMIVVGLMNEGVVDGLFYYCLRYDLDNHMSAAKKVFNAMNTMALQFNRKR